MGISVMYFFYLTECIMWLNSSKFNVTIKVMYFLHFEAQTQHWPVAVCSGTTALLSSEPAGPDCQ